MTKMTKMTGNPFYARGPVEPQYFAIEENKKMNTNTEILEKLRGIIAEMNLEYSKIILFGSRARGDFREESDWDFLIVLEKPLNAKTKKELWFDIYKKLHESYPFISFDIILKDAESFEEEKTIANTISNEVYLEGVEA